MASQWQTEGSEDGDVHHYCMERRWVKQHQELHAWLTSKPESQANSSCPFSDLDDDNNNEDDSEEELETKESNGCKVASFVCDLFRH